MSNARVFVLTLALACCSVERAIAFAFCWLQYPHEGRQGQSGWAGPTGWQTDYPRAGQNLAERFGEVTGVAVERDTPTKDGRLRPRVILVDIEDADDDRLFTCPLVYTQDVSDMGLTDVGRGRLREYFAKGGVLWVDDFWGADAWAAFQRTVYAVDSTLTLTTAPAALRHALYELPWVPVRVVDGRTWGRSLVEHPDAGPARLWVMVDRKDRPVIIVCHDTDYGDPWTLVRTSAYLREFGPIAFSVGINVILYVMTH